MSQTFLASTTFNDWEGTLAADNADARDMWSILTERGLVTEGDLDGVLDMLLAFVEEAG